MTYCYLDSPVGPLLIAGDGESIRQISFPREGHATRPSPDWSAAPSGPVLEAARQLRAYFDGRRSDFDLPIAPEGTGFQLSVWKRLQDIPYGQTISYGELARRVGNPKASRAVGAANRANPIPIVIPCHRVIGANGKLTGFGGGLPVKDALLRLETSQMALTGNEIVAGR